MGARHRPRRHRDAERRREDARRRRKDEIRPRPRSVRQADRGVRRRDRRRDPPAAQGDRRVGRLDAHGVHAVAGTVTRRARGVRASLRARADLPRLSRDPLVPALPHVVERRGGGVPRRAGHALSHRVSGGRPTRSLAHDRHNASRDDARRRRGGGESERRSVSRSRGQDSAVADRRHLDPGGGRRLRRSGIRHRAS